MRSNWQPVAVLALALLLPQTSRAETGRAGWLRYAALSSEARARYANVPRVVARLDDSLVVQTAAAELARGLDSMLGGTTSIAPLDRRPAIVLGTLPRVRAAIRGLADRNGPRRDADLPATLPADAFWVGTVGTGAQRRLVIAGGSDRGVLYGVFRLLERIALHADVPASLEERPAAPVRWVNHWDNLDGTIERGYAGRSIFFEGGRVVDDLVRVREYARLLASIGINGATINNVNANAAVVTDEFLPQLARVAEAMRPWGVSLSISIDFSSPMRVGGLDTFDPLDPRVVAFWKDRVDAIYRAVPDLGGVVLKADSEGRLGPSAYGRTHADAANVVARALAPHGGLIFYRGFVYNNRMDWRDLKNDRARAAVDNFKSLDGAFDANVVVQIKHGPIDFQVREPASPLFGVLERTNQAIELQITQEYLGQQRHVCFLPPMWKEVLDFDMQARGRGTPVKAIVAGKTFNRPTGGFVGVSNVGRDENWLGHDLAMANLYGFGRLAWNPDTPSDAIAADWTKLTFGDDPKVVSTITGILNDSWLTYERYSGNLGIGTLTDILGVHFGPGIESSERNGWGQWHRADGRGVGMDRTVATGTGFTSQYRSEVAARYESLETTPDELLLFFHHVPYTHRLKNGKTVIQHIYDEHFDGASQAARFVDRWRTLDGAIDAERFAAVLRRLEFQEGHAVVWRDAITNWFRWVSGIPDDKRRTGAAAGTAKLPDGSGPLNDRTEAESLQLEGFTSSAVTPWETASGALAATCGARRTCAGTLSYHGAAGTFDIATQFFDESDGVSKYRLIISRTGTFGRTLLDQWIADGDVQNALPNGHTSTRHITHRVRLAPGDQIRIEVDTDGNESGAVDYLEITASR